jgi:hypothetical protein
MTVITLAGNTQAGPIEQVLALVPILLTIFVAVFRVTLGFSIRAAHSRASP